MQIKGIEQQILQVAMDCGAFGAEYLPAASIVLDPQFRQICESNGCGRFGRCYQCPPDIGPIHERMQEVRRYPKAVIYQSVSSIEDSFDFEGMMDAATLHLQLSQRIHAQLPSVLRSDFLHLSNGCRLCSRCAKEDDLPCRHSDIALGAVEGYGIDVYRTVKNTSLKYINGENTVTYFGAILFSE